MKRYKYLSVLLILFVPFLWLTAMDDGLTPLERLGKSMYFDKISVPAEVQACADCHHPEAGWVGLDSDQNLHIGILVGATGFFADRSPNSSAYAAYSPVFNYDEKGFYGGNMWDGRAHGYFLGNPTFDQARLPILSPVEHGNDQLNVLRTIALSEYAYQWEEAFGAPIDTINTYDNPVHTSPFWGVHYVDYHKVGMAWGAYQKSKEVSAFSSKYDYFLKGKARLNRTEKRGMDIFNKNCASCHISKPGPKGEKPLFTDNRFWNIGVPKNPALPRYERDPEFIDLGVGKTIRTMAADFTFDPFSQNWRNEPYVPERMLAFTGDELMALADEYDGKFRTPTLRNIMVVPDAEFVKAYMHNGVIKTLKGAMELHNSRGNKKWDSPEFAGNMETELVGDMGLSNRDMLYIKAFLNTLTDGYVPRTKYMAEVDEFEGAINAAVITPTDFAFKLTGPNPFNPSTSFQLDLPDAENVKVVVFNTLGQRVATLVNEVLPAGNHRVEFNAGHLASGLYLVSVSTPIVTEFKKIALVK